MSQENDDTHVENADTDSTASAPMDISETIGPATMEYIVSNFIYWYDYFYSQGKLWDTCRAKLGFVLK